MIWSALPLMYIQSTERETSLALDQALGRNMSLAQRSALATGAQTFIIWVPTHFDSNYDEGGVYDCVSAKQCFGKFEDKLAIETAGRYFANCFGVAYSPRVYHNFMSTILSTLSRSTRLFDEIKVE